MGGVELSVSASALQLDASSEAGRPCRLAMKLPARVDSTRVAAKFSAKKRRLKLVVPLETPVVAPSTPAAVVGPAAPESAGRAVCKLPGMGTTYTVLLHGRAGHDKSATVERGDTVIVHAVGVVKATGKTFWSTRGAEPFEYNAGVGGVIRGWDQGCMGMRLGEMRELSIPAAEGYKREGFPRWGIPPNAALQFTIEVLKIAKGRAF